MDGDNDKIISELKVKLQQATATIREQAGIIYQQKRELDHIMSEYKPDDVLSSWTSLMGDLANLEYQLKLAESSEKKAAEYNNILQKKLLECGRE